MRQKGPTHARGGRNVRYSAACGFLHGETVVARNILKTGKKTRPKTAVRGKRYLCALCRKRSPRPVKTPAPWYCPVCQRQKAEAANPTGA